MKSSNISAYFYVKKCSICDRVKNFLEGNLLRYSSWYKHLKDIAMLFKFALCAILNYNIYKL